MKMIRKAVKQMGDREKVEVIVSCAFCQKETVIKVRWEDYVDWQSGKLIQSVMPYLSNTERELLISETCGDCFDDMFKEWC